MSQDKRTTNAIEMSKDDRSSLVVGILTLTVAVAIFFVLLAALGNLRRIDASIDCTATQLRRGNETYFEIHGKHNFDEGTQVTWYANGQEIARTTTTNDQPLCLSYTPSQCGQLCLQAKVGDKYTKNAYFWVDTPLLTVSAPNVTITYGDKIPQLSLDCCGFVDSDCCDDVCYDGQCQIKLEDGTVWQDQQQNLPVGSYTICADKECCFKDYQVEYVCGTLTVLPKKLTVKATPKHYDGTTNIDTHSLHVDGVVSGEQVALQCDSAQFADKNVGKCKTIHAANLKLVGSDATNYTIDGNVVGDVLPKPLHVVGFAVDNKIYDGSTKAKIGKIGKLIGVVDGDNVAIGSISARFDNAYVGQNKHVEVFDLTLVGLDKDNYFVVDLPHVTANITN